MSDFPAERDSRRLITRIGTVGASTFALGFTEGCLHFAHGPIPLRFAVKYALYNLIPSMVWKTVAASLVATTTNVSHSRLVSGLSQESVNVEVTKYIKSRPHRIVAIKSIRSLRYATASYGFLWSLWQWNNDDSMNFVAEQIVRISPYGSKLTQTSIEKHGKERILHIPHESVQQQLCTEQKPCIGITRSAHDVSSVNVVEVELDGTQSGDWINHLTQTKRMASPLPTITVGINTFGPDPLDVQQYHAVDIYYEALAGIITFVEREFCLYTTTGTPSMLLITRCPHGTQPKNSKDRIDERDWPTAAAEALRQVLLRSSGGQVHHLQVPFEQNSSASFDRGNYQSIPVVVLVVDDASEVDSLVSDLEHLGIRVPDLVICANSVSSSTTKTISSWYSVVDSCDRVLQDIRVLIRRGNSIDSIQQHVYNTYGQQRSLYFRSDQFSNVGNVL